MRYLEVSIRCRREAGEAVSNLLSELTGGGYAVDDPLDILRNRASWEITDLVPGDPDWLTVRGWIAEAAGAEAARTGLEQMLDGLRRAGLGEIEPPCYQWVQEEDWANNWKAYFKPFRVGERLVVVPSWEEYELREGELPLLLDPGMAFGTGTHATTALCLHWLERLIQPGARVLDVGTGSGILAIAAARLGADQVLGIDLDPVAVEVARENVARNQVPVEVRLSTLTEVEPEECELVVANIIASVIIDLLPEIARRMKSGGRFLASGIIAEKRQEVVQAMTGTWLLPTEVRTADGWVAILAVKP